MNNPAAVLRKSRWSGRIQKSPETLVETAPHSVSSEWEREQSRANALRMFPKRECGRNTFDNQKPNEGDEDGNEE